MSDRRRSVILLVSAVVLWSTSGLFIKLSTLNPLALAGGRSAITALVLLAWIGKPRFTWSSSQIGGALSMVLTFGLFVTATQLTSAANAILLQFTAPLYVALFGGWQGMAQRLLAGTEFESDEDHGGRSEMSMTLYAAPQLAHPERAVDLPVQNATEPVNVRGPFSNVVPHGYSGAPSQGSAQEGEAIVNAIAAVVGPFLRNLAAQGWMNGSWMSGIDAPDASRDPRHPRAR